MDKRRVMQIETLHEIISKPRNIFVALFIGDSPMNMLQGLVVSEGFGFFIAFEKTDIKFFDDKDVFVELE